MISQELMEQIATFLEQRTLSEAILPELRAAFSCGTSMCHTLQAHSVQIGSPADLSGVHFSYCLDDDVGNVEAALQRGAFNLYLIDGRDHCLRLTTDASVATGLLVAEVVQD